MKRTIYHWVKQEVKALCIFSHIINLGEIEGDLEKKGRYLGNQSNKVMDMIKDVISMCENVTIKPIILV